MFHSDSTTAKKRLIQSHTHTLTHARVIDQRNKKRNTTECVEYGGKCTLIYIHYFSIRYIHIWIIVWWNTITKNIFNGMEICFCRLQYHLFRSVSVYRLAIQYARCVLSAVCCVLHMCKHFSWCLIILWAFHFLTHAHILYYLYGFYSFAVIFSHLKGITVTPAINA